MADPLLPHFPDGVAGHQANLARIPFMTSTIGLFAELDRPLRMMEVGSWIGSSVYTWTESIQQFLPKGGTLLCVDPWMPYFDERDVLENNTPTYKEMDKAAQDDTAYDLFQHNAKVCEATFNVPVSHKRGLSKDILPTLEDSAFDIVYIDGSHAYDDVKIDIEQGKRLVRDGGILCGDDLEITLEDITDVETLREWRNRDYITITQGEESHQCHPGVTLAVAEALGHVSRFNGYWVMRREGDAFRKIEFPDFRSFLPHFWNQAQREKYVAVIREIVEKEG